MACWSFIWIVVRLVHMWVWRGQIIVATSISLQICSLHWNTCFETIHVCLATRKKFLFLISSSSSSFDTYPGLDRSDHCRHLYKFRNLFSTLEHMFWDHPCVSSHPQKVSGPTLLLFPVLTLILGWRDQITVATSITFQICSLHWNTCFETIHSCLATRKKFLSLHSSSSPSQHVSWAGEVRSLSPPL